MAANQPTVLPHEDWKPVPGYEGYYEVSNLGQVKSLPRKVNRNGFPMAVPGRVMKQSKTSNGYWKVLLSKDGLTKNVMVHTAVAAAFLGARPDGSVIRHLNGDQTDNRAENLSYGTQSDNMRDMERHGRGKKFHTTCKWGHPLKGDNLTPWGKNRRGCLACDRARKRLNGRQFTDTEFLKVSNRELSKILKYGHAGKPPRTHCKRGHLLDGNNLVKNRAEKGIKACRACNIAGGYIRHHHLPVSELQSLSDKKFSEIMR